MEKLTGERNGTIKYFLNGHFYHKMKNEPGEENIVYRCATRSTTSCTAIITEKIETGILTFSGVHIDELQIHGATICRLKQTMLELAKTTSRPVKEIYNSVIEG